jgi:RNA polymerase sigma-70 factor (ECF subfamily)
MKPPRRHPDSVQERAGRFATTHWSVVLAAGRETPSEARDALASLCEAYWYPLYAFVRQRGFNSNDAQDLTQAFFTRLLEKRSLAAVDPAQGKFRSFLLVCMKNFLANEWDWSHAKRRGGGQTILSMETGMAEQRYLVESADCLTPERLFERRWALTILERALDRLRNFCVAAGKEKQFDHLQVYLGGKSGAPTYREMAAELDMTEDAVKTAVHRLRHRYRRELRAEIALTVGEPDQIDDEIRDLFAALEV